MSISTKYAPFTKRTKHGFRGKPFSVSSYITWDMYADCDNNGMFTLYTAITDIDLIVGVELFSDTALTIPYPLNSSFTHSGDVYNTGEDGSITSLRPCSREWSGYGDCTASISKTRFTAWNQPVLQSGIILYDSNSLTTPATNDYFRYNDTTYATDANGEITTLSTCPIGINVYPDCGSITPSEVFVLPTTVISGGAELANGEYMWADINKTSYVSNGTYVFNGKQYLIVSGVIAFYASCST